MNGLPSNLPPWARTAFQWAIIGGAVVYAYSDMSRDIDDFKKIAERIGTRLESIDIKIEPLDVDRERQKRLEKDVEELRAWQRAVLERERNARP